MRRTLSRTDENFRLDGAASGHAMNRQPAFQVPPARGAYVFAQESCDFFPRLQLLALLGIIQPTHVRAREAAAPRMSSNAL